MSGRFSLNLSADNYAVMGNPIRHSKSPAIHALFAEQTGQSIFYQAIEVAPDGFRQALDSFYNEGGKGLNITAPLKGAAHDCCDQLTHIAAQAKSVNTIRFDASGSRLGDTTDGIGLLNDLSNNDIRLNKRSILILGAGGAVRGIIGSIYECRPKRIIIANRTGSRAQDLADDYQGGIEVGVSTFEGLEGGQFDLIINGTSAGLAGEIPQLPEKILEPGGCCYDLMYSDKATPFVKWGRRHGASLSIDGLGMLVEQAAESFRIWRGLRPETRPVIQTLRNARQVK